MKLSVVTTLYRSAASIEEFYRRAIKAAEKIAGDVELVMVNDGSPDNSLDLALELQKHDARVIVVDLSRNFGHHKALMTGLAHAGGDLVFLIDSDLEEQPEDLALFYQRFSAGDCDVVYGIQKARRGSIFERMSGGVFFAVVDMLGDRPLPRNSGHLTVDAARLCQRPDPPSRPRLRHRRPLAGYRLSADPDHREQAVAVAIDLFSEFGVSRWRSSTSRRRRPGCSIWCSIPDF